MPYTQVAFNLDTHWYSNYGSICFLTIVFLSALQSENTKGHDDGPMLSLLGALRAIDVPDEWAWPPFASYIALELSDKGLARFLYNGKILKTPFCTTTSDEPNEASSSPTEGTDLHYYCSRSELFEKLQEIIPTEEDCKASENGDLATDDSLDSAIYI